MFKKQIHFVKERRKERKPNKIINVCPHTQSLNAPIKMCKIGSLYNEKCQFYYSMRPISFDAIITNNKTMI